ncbi:MAG: hypothetical protein ACLP70_23920 [Streptosporangiaceae bacterium]
MSTHSELARDVTEHSFSRAWTTILAERQDAPIGGWERVTFADGCDGASLGRWVVSELVGKRRS